MPVTDALVDLVGTGQPGHYTFTGRDGSFRIYGAPKGPVALRAGKYGFSTQITNVVVDADARYDLTLTPAERPRSLIIGSRIASVVTQDDPICATSDPYVEDGEAGLGLVGPCKTFLVTIPEDGTLVATASWASKDLYMTMLTPLHGICCGSPLNLHFPVTAGSIIELSVSIHASDMSSPDATAPFELMMRLDGAVSNR